MTFSYRITKYNPIYRDEKGAYLKNEWTSYSDIGHIFDGKQLNIDEYLNVEDKYIGAVVQFMKCIGINGLYISELEKKCSPNNDINSTDQMVSLYSKIKNNYVVHTEEIADMCRLILREYIWCKLKNDLDLEIHFGYDYYMYIISKSACIDTVCHIQKSGLFVEKYVSPYL